MCVRLLRIPKANWRYSGLQVQASDDRVSEVRTAALPRLLLVPPTGRTRLKSDSTRVERSRGEVGMDAAG